MRTIVWVLAFGLLPMQAGAQSVPEQLSRVFGGKPDPLFAIVTAVVAAPVIVAGAMVTAGAEIGRERPEPAGVIRPKKQRPQLALIPTTPPPEPVARPLTAKERADREQAVRVNDALVNTALAVGGAAVVGSIIYGILKK